MMKPKSIRCQRSNHPCLDAKRLERAQGALRLFRRKAASLLNRLSVDHQTQSVPLGARLVNESDCELIIHFYIFANSS